ncbi:MULTISPECIES: type IX secretion system membrane protein PorP/SprF [unclassified Lentimicrobium]|uniref:PorP/SprF family type IX secretion system membrane protein n=1 Tax=unclassified Lentimicrobium TaxID=2677434 RepID=UPI0015578AB3|nr:MULTISPECIES: type IX secretion system membrane protein PorP/SprF [unclassified Lentimicrobium]NPD44441.1 type IX secretion system membrane protein PorP/SprF [Lentimicrobium sp. S6]NPD84293.1 type IX secretion system membrane protein PorP/SprF [Lentimicrobium sp. L6]
MFKKALAFFIIILVIVNDSVAQQEQTFTQYMFVPSVYNPGFTGSRNAICATGIMKQQWVGLEGAPTVYAVSLESPVKMLKGGLGGVISSDQIGGFSTTKVKLNYAYHRKVGNALLGIGVGIGLANKKVDFSYFNVQGEDPLLTSTEEESGMIFDIDAGLYYQKSDKWYLGLSSTQINQGTMEVAGGKTQLKRRYYFTGGYNLKFVRMPKIEVRPSVFLAYTQNSPILLNVGVIGEYNKSFWGGVVYKHQEGVALMAGVNYKNIKVGYAYDINMNALKNGGSHEIRLGYCFKLEIEKPNRSYKNTRFL